MQNFGQFFATSDFGREYLRIGLRCPNQKGTFSISILPAFYETDPVNFGPLIPESGPTKMHFLGYYISALSGCCALKFLHALEIDQGYLVQTPTGTGVPPKKFNRGH